MSNANPFMNPRRQYLIKVLGQVQNEAAHQNRDILSITCLMTDNEVAKHLQSCIEQATKYRTYTIEPIGNQFLVHTGGMYGYHYFPTIEAAKGMIDIWWMRS